MRGGIPDNNFKFAWTRFGLDFVVGTVRGHPGRLDLVEEGYRVVSKHVGGLTAAPYQTHTELEVLFHSQQTFDPIYYMLSAPGFERVV